MGTMTMPNSFLPRSRGSVKPSLRLYPALWVRGAKILFFAALVSITLGSLTPSQSFAGPDLNDKFLHFIAYGSLAGLGGIAWPEQRLRFTFIAVLFWGLGIELLQAIMPLGRQGSLYDGLANGGGALCACLGLYALSRFRTKS